MKRLAIVFLILVLTGSAPASPSSETLEDALLHQVAAQLATDRARLSLGPSDLPTLPGPVTDYRFEFGSTPRGRTVVRGHSELHRDVTFTIDVRLWDSAWVVTSPVERGETLSLDRLSRSYLDVTDEPAWSGELALMRARRTLRPGMRLSHTAVEPLPLIVRGRTVTLSAAARALKVSRTGVALSDAHLGEPVRVRVDKHTVISATAAGANLCVVGLQE